MFRSGAAITAVVTLLAAGVAWFAMSQRASPRPSIVLITIDTLRADHLEAYGYDRPTAPRIKQLADRGVLFQSALSQANWTLPAMASILTSLYPFEHGAVLAERKLGPQTLTLAQALRDAGYHTIGVVSHTFVSSQYGFDRGFVVFDESQIKDDDATTSAALSQLATLRVAEAPRPFFLWVHYFDPHYSYVRQPDFDFAAGYEGPLGERIDWWSLEKMRRKQQLTPADLRYAVNVYDEEIAHTDRAIGDLLDGIEALGPSGEVVYIVTADHGESFMERGRLFHNRDVYDELIRVPLVIAGAISPDYRGLIATAPVETRSIPATVMVLAGVAGHGFQGRDLLRSLNPAEAPPYVFSEGSAAWNPEDRTRAVVGGGWKLIQLLDTGGYELYDLTRDPVEKRDRYTSDDAEVRKIRGKLQRALDGFGRTGAPSGAALEMTDELEGRLRALGYAK